METIKIIGSSFLFLIGAYIFFRVITLAIATSWKQVMYSSFIIGGMSDIGENEKKSC